MSIAGSIDQPFLPKAANQTLPAKKAMDFIMLRSITPPLRNDMMGGDAEQAFASIEEKRGAVLSKVIAVSLTNYPEKRGRH
jgi:hypothetical protein